MVGNVEHVQHTIHAGNLMSLIVSTDMYTVDLSLSIPK